MAIYGAFANTPKEAQRTIAAGKLKGMTDINPMWRIKTLTQQFGPCGDGWKVDVVDMKPFEAGGEVMAHCVLALSWKKEDGTWSEPVYGVGGSKMAGKGVGDGINDECVDGDCDVLTEHGWIPFKEYDGITPIAQYDKLTKQISFVKPINFIHKTSLDTYKKGDIIMTGGHRVLYEDAKHNMRVDIAENLCGYKGRAKFDVRYGFFGEPVALTTMQKIGIMLQADGTKFKTDKDSGVITWSLGLAKQRKVERARQLLNEAGIEITYDHTSRRDNPKWGDYTQIRFRLDGTDYKALSNFLPLANYVDLAEEVVFWDGAYDLYKKDGYFSWCSTNKDNIDYLQTLFAMGGVCSSVGKRHRSGNKTDCYVLYNKIDRTRIVPIERYGEATEVYCVEVPSTFFLIRKSNEIFVTGNCFKMAFTDALSICCKNLGMSADIYYEKDKQDRTKYTAAASDDDRLSDEQEKIKKQIMSCQSKDELVKLYNEEFGGNKSASKYVKQLTQAKLTEFTND